MSLSLSKNKLALVFIILWLAFGTNVLATMTGPFDVYVVRDATKDSASLNATIDTVRPRLEEAGHTFQYLPDTIQDEHDNPPQNELPVLEDAKRVGYPALVIAKDGQVIRSKQLPSPPTADDILSFVGGF